MRNWLTLQTIDRRWVLALLVCAWSCLLLAQPEPNAARFAVVNMKRIIDGAPQFAEGKRRVLQELGASQAQLNADEARLTELQRKRAQQGATMPKAELDTLLRTIEASERALKRGRDALNQKVTLRSNEVVRELEQKIGEVIAEVAKSQGYDAVLSDESAVYANPKLDITDAVLARLRAR
jgi:outer membrane protein